MKKQLIPILLLIIPIVAGVQCQISEDNSTWINIEASNYGGCIDDNSSISYIQNLQAGTIYYLRCKNSTTDWGYQKIKTKEGGYELNMIGAIFGLLIIMGFFAMIGYSANNIEKNIVKKMSIRLFGYGLALIQLVNIAFVMYLDSLDASLEVVFRVNFYVILLLAFGMAMINLIGYIIRLIFPSESEADEEKKCKVEK